MELEIEKIVNLHKEYVKVINKSQKVLEDYFRRVSECIARTLLCVAQNPNTKWKRRPCGGAPGSLSETNSRSYRTELGEGYEMEISWYNYPDDTGSIGNTESYRESFHVFITGDKKIKIPWRSRRLRRDKYQEFPYHVLYVGYDKNMRLEINKELAVLDEKTQERVRTGLIRLVNDVREKLG
ncbi:MAG: hypothetical protein ABIJ83_03915 [Patescibacteria group bacterium]